MCPFLCVDGYDTPQLSAMEITHGIFIACDWSEVSEVVSVCLCIQENYGNVPSNFT